MAHFNKAQRAAILRKIDRLIEDGSYKSWSLAAKATASTTHGLTPRTLYRWRKLQAKGSLDRARRSDRGQHDIELPSDAFACLKADWLRPEQPTMASCIRRYRAVAPLRGWPVPSRSTLQERLRQIDPRERLVGRGGINDAMPYQQRSVSDMAPLEEVGCDGHTLDALVDWRGDGKGRRIVLSGWQDVRTRAILAWTLSESESADSYRLSFGDMCRKWGAPQRVHSDNGRAFCAASVTGGRVHSYRDDNSSESGIITKIVGGENIHHTNPYSGRSKPIERAFGMLAKEIGTHPLIAGSYTGPGPERKPDNYGSKLATRAEVESVVAAAVASWNNSIRSAMGMTPMEAMASLPYLRRTVSQPLLDSCRYIAVSLTALKRDGSISLHGARYWSADMMRFAGLSKTARKVAVLYDPNDLSSLYVQDGHDRICCARVSGTQFRNETDAKRVASERRRLVKDAKKFAASSGLPKADLLAYSREAAKAQADLSQEAERAALEAAENSILLSPAAASYQGSGVDFDPELEEGERLIREYGESLLPVVSVA